MNKDYKEKIKKLKNEGKYDEIFAEFGSKAYLINTPRSIKRAELKKFKRERRYEDIFNKYGKEEYNKILIKAMFEEIKEARGLGKALAWRMRKIFLKGTSLSLAAVTSVSIAFPIANQSTVSENAITYAEEIENYNEKIDDYASHVNSMNLSDIQIFMKVMDDMWGSIQGYKTPEKDIHGFLELDLANEDGYGVCRNMASDVARKLQEINPDYNARTIAVYIEDGFKIADIERTVLETNETVQEDSSEEQEQNSIISAIQNFVGNHMVTLVDVKENGEKITLVLDPTNPGIGIYKDGTIIMLNTVDGNLTELDSKEISTAMLFRTGFDAAFKSISDFVSSFKDTSISLDEIITKYGLEAQNKALTEVRALETADAVMQQSEKKENDFEERIKVDISELIENNSKTTSQKANLKKVDTEHEMEK